MWFKDIKRKHYYLTVHVRFQLYYHHQESIHIHTFSEVIIKINIYYLCVFILHIFQNGNTDKSFLKEKYQLVWINIPFPEYTDRVMAQGDMGANLQQAVIEYLFQHQCVYWFPHLAGRLLAQHTTHYEWSAAGIVSLPNIIVTNFLIIVLAWLNSCWVHKQCWCVYSYLFKSRNCR